MTKSLRFTDVVRASYRYTTDKLRKGLDPKKFYADKVYGILVGNRGEYQVSAQVVYSKDYLAKEGKVVAAIYELDYSGERVFTVVVDDNFLNLPSEQRDAILCHEMGHILDPEFVPSKRAKRELKSEIYADSIATSVMGVDVMNRVMSTIREFTPWYSQRDPRERSKHIGETVPDVSVTMIPYSKKAMPPATAGWFDSSLIADQIITVWFGVPRITSRTPEVA